MHRFGHEAERLSKRREHHREERRKPHVEVNLLAENEGGRVINKARRGCTLPFFGTGVLLFVIEAVRAGLG
jgi:hypothetical protein